MARSLRLPDKPAKAVLTDKPDSAAVIDKPIGPRSRPGVGQAGRDAEPGSVGGRDDSQVTAPAELVTVAGVALLVLAGSGRAGRLAYRLGQRNQVVGGGRRGFELALVADQFPAPGRGERASVRLTQVVRVRLGECRERADDRR